MHSWYAEHSSDFQTPAIYGTRFVMSDFQILPMTTDDTSHDESRFQILALDGGGYKGMFAASLLACLEQDLGIEIADHFDLITGTSTGGIIALGLGAALRPAEIADFYLEHGPGIFRRRLPGPALLRSKYRASGLERALTEILGDTTLAESRCRLAIPAYDLTNDDVYLFRTPHSEPLRRDLRDRMVDVGLATSAAPTYLPAQQLRGLRLIDGGMWANCPALVGIAEAVHVFGVPLSEISILSIGTTTEATRRPIGLDHGGLWAWREHAIPVVLRGQALATCNDARLLLGNHAVMRVDPTVPDRELRLDGVTPDQLRGRAEHFSRRISQKFSDRFTAHRARPYEPVVKEHRC